MPSRARNTAVRSPWILLIVFVAVVALASDAAASSSRVLSMGGAGDFLEDADNVLLWYGSLASYPDLVLLELGDYVEDPGDTRNARQQGGGAHFGLDSDRRWGVAAAYLHGDDQDDPSRPLMRFAWGRSWGGIQAGAAVRYRSDLEELALDGWFPYSREREDITLGAGLRVDLDDEFYLDLAGDLTWNERRFVRNNEILADEDFSADTFGLRLRCFRALSERVVLVPAISHGRETHAEFGLFGETDDDAYDLDRQSTTAGLGLNIFPDPDVMLVVSAAWTDRELDVGSPRRDATTLRSRSEDITLHELRIGLETRPRSWLSVRAGVRQITYDQKVRDALRNTVDSDFEAFQHDADTVFDLTIGLGLHLGDFDADLVFNDDAPFALGSFLTGGGREEDANFTRITLGYCF